MQNAATVSALLLLALAGAFLFTHFCCLTHYTSSRIEGQRLLLMTAGGAVPLLIWSSAFLLIVEWLLPESAVEWIRYGWEALVTPLNVSALPVFLGAFVWGPILAWLVNTRYEPETASALVIEKYGREVERLLYAAINKPLPISVNLKNRKVYVGWAVYTPDFRRGDLQDIRLLPSLSGYRDEKTQELRFTTQYNGVYRRIDNGSIRGLRPNDFEIVIPIDEVASVNLFSPINQDLFKMPAVPSERVAEGRSEGTSFVLWIAVLLAPLIIWALRSRARRD